MSGAYEGKQIVGMDQHRRRLVLVRLTEIGEQLERCGSRMTRSTCGVVMARAVKSPEVVLEAAYGWYWAADTIAELGARCICAHPVVRMLCPVVPLGSRRLRALNLMKLSPTGGLLTSTPSRRTRRRLASRLRSGPARLGSRSAGSRSRRRCSRLCRSHTRAEVRASCGGYELGSQPSHRVAPRGGCVGPALPLMTPRPAVGPVAVAGLVTASRAARPVVSGSRPIFIAGRSVASFG